MCSKCVYHSRMFIVQLQDHAVSVYNPFLNLTLWTKENYRYVCYEICCSTLPVYEIDVKLLSLLSSGRDIFHYTWDLIFYLRPVTYNDEDSFLQEESKDNMQHVTIVNHNFFKSYVSEDNCIHKRVSMRLQRKQKYAKNVIPEIISSCVSLRLLNTRSIFVRSGSSVTIHYQFLYSEFKK